ncbi:hypothetical protein NP233_g9934 [Leucocoprinus birnbaumii]|uniref:Uncharacterized protein n=1 Tax=Leucocoprinus birnbaumii TaxID=56174 RepID=A0AAD5VJS1_9AGAR|nr:hypothetical protein NP233_g9934 [Leucocoprinus birnbaumii]
MSVSPLNIFANLPPGLFNTPSPLPSPHATPPNPLDNAATMLLLVPPSESNLINEITTTTQAEFLDTFQAHFDVIHTMKNKVYGAQIKWVRKNVMGPFIKEFGPVSPRMAAKVDRYLRNHSVLNRTTTTRRVSGTAATSPTRAVQWRHVMGREMKDAIELRMNQLRAANGITSRGNHLQFYKQARDEILKGLSPKKVAEFKATAESETQDRKASPTRQNVYDRQPMIAGIATDAISDHFGWGPGQFGDVVCFIAVTYRNKDGLIQTDFSVVSNQYIPGNDSDVPTLVNTFRDQVDPVFKKVAEGYIPAQGPMPMDIDFESMAPKVLRDSLSQGIENAWVSSGSVEFTRTPKTLPWPELETSEGRAKYLSTPSDFDTLGFMRPATAQSIDWLTKFAQALNASTVPLFRKAGASSSTSALDSSPSLSSASSTDSLLPSSPVDSTLPWLPSLDFNLSPVPQPGSGAAQDLSSAPLSPSSLLAALSLVNPNGTSQAVNDTQANTMPITNPGSTPAPPVMSQGPTSIGIPPVNTGDDSDVDPLPDTLYGITSPVDPPANTDVNGVMQHDTRGSIPIPTVGTSSSRPSGAPCKAAATKPSPKATSAKTSKATLKGRAKSSKK